MDEVKVSIIVPVYNVEKYLRECLDSLVNQTIDSKEIILVNDGSTDNSLKICEEYQKKYSYIKTIIQNNQGQSAARNKGIHESIGKYIYFMDSDDYITTECLEKFYQLCENYNLDMIRGKYHIFLEKDNRHVAAYDWSKFKYLHSSIDTYMYLEECIKSRVYEVTPILGLIKRQFFIDNHLFFTPGVIMEDHEFTLKSLTTKHAGKIMQLDYDFYTYRRRPNSTTTTPNIKSIRNIVTNVENMTKYISQSTFPKEVENSAKKATSALVYHATAVYGRLPKDEKLKAQKILSKDILKFSIKILLVHI